MADSTDPKPTSATTEDTSAVESGAPEKHESHAERKRKRFNDDGLKFGRGGKKRDMGRNAWQ